MSTPAKIHRYRSRISNRSNDHLRLTKEYNEVINNIYEKQSNLSKLVKKQTHIIKDEVNIIHQDRQYSRKVLEQDKKSCFSQLSVSFIKILFTYSR